MKKFLTTFLITFALMNLGLTLHGFVSHAEDNLADDDPPSTMDNLADDDPPDQFNNVGEDATTDKKTPTYIPGTPTPYSTLEIVGDPDETGYSDPNFGLHPDTPAIGGYSGVDVASSPIYFAIDLFRYAMSGIALLIVLVSAIKLVGGAAEEEANKAKMTLLYAIAGLVVIQLAGVIVKEMIFGEEGEGFSDIAEAELKAQNTVQQIRGIVGFIEILIGAVAVLVIIIRGIILLASAGNEEAQKKATTHILYALGALVLIGLSELIVRGFIFPAAGEELPNIATGKQIFMMVTNFIAGAISIISFLIMLYAGVRYVASGGKEDVNEQVKKIFTGALIGLLLGLGAFAAVNTVLRVDTSENEPPADTSTVNLPESN